MSAIASTRSSAGRLSARTRGFILGFSATLLVALLLATVAAVGLGLAAGGRALSGVSIGGVSVGGLDRAGVESRLASGLPSLTTGTATLVIDGRPVTVPYAQIDRGYELTVMADAALATGKSGNPLAAGIARLRDALRGTTLPVMVRAYDPGAMAGVLAELASEFDAPPVDAAVTVGEDGAFAVTGSRPGAAVDPDRVRALLGAATATANPGDVTVEVPLTVVAPAVTTAQAQAAMAVAHAMVDRPLVLGVGDKQLSMDPAKLASALRFATDASGTYAPRVDGAALAAVVAELAPSVDRKATDASYHFGTTVTVVPAVAGQTLDQAAAETAIRDALEARASGADPGKVSLPVLVTQPALTTDMAEASVNKLVRISSWTTYYVPGVSNGYGVNISIPARKLNGFVVGPGETFDFWTDIGPVTTAEGYRYGGAIINGKSEPTGALAGGICSTSTTLFNAALRAGYQMGSRVNHFYYISRYPVGLDATVFADGASVTTMSWTNDTAYPVIIRSATGYGFVRFDLYSVPTGRTVTLTKPVITNRTYGHDVVQYTTALKPGQQQRLEGIINGFDAVVVRYVRDASGKVIHTDRYFSHYHAVNGLLLVGKPASTPAPSPTPGPSSTPAPTPTPAPSGTPAP